MEKTSVKYRILEAARPYLEGKTVKDLVVVDVYKERSIYVINEAIVEIAETTFNGVPMRTICVEHTDPENVINVVRMLEADKFENINYIQAMKKAVGLL